jgi:hypothetical protein
VKLSDVKADTTAVIDLKNNLKRIKKIKRIEQVKQPTMIESQR